nr:MAG TPA: hypothetical protein [Caudoviricetes sp.]
MLYFCIVVIGGAHQERRGKKYVDNTDNICGIKIIVVFLHCCYGVLSEEDSQDLFVAIHQQQQTGKVTR